MLAQPGETSCRWQTSTGQMGIRWTLSADALRFRRRSGRRVLGRRGPRSARDQVARRGSEPRPANALADRRTNAWRREGVLDQVVGECRGVTRSISSASGSERAARYKGVTRSEVEEQAANGPPRRGQPRRCGKNEVYQRGRRGAR